MIDESFKSEADRLTANIRKLIVTEEESYKLYSDKVASLTNELQTNKDLQNDRSENNSYVITKENRDIAQAMVNNIGFMLLMLLMVYVTFNDILRLF